MLFSNYFAKTSLAIVLAIACASCQNSQPQQLVPTPTPLPTLPPQVLKIDRSPRISPYYQQAIETAQHATQLSQQAQSIEDWQAVTRQWQAAIELMKQVPANDGKHREAVQSLDLLAEGVSRSKAEVRRIQDNAIAQAAEVKAAQAVEDATQRLKERNERLTTATTAKLYRAPIKSYNNGIPVIDVVFNNGLHFEMMVDTGASSTMITEPMATALKVETITSVMAKTPSGETRFPVGYLDSIAVGESSIQNIPVAIGPVGLLGHDFFGDCNINIKRDQNVIEFSQCN